MCTGVRRWSGDRREGCDRRRRSNGTKARCHFRNGLTVATVSPPQGTNRLPSTTPSLSSTTPSLSSTTPSQFRSSSDGINGVPWPGDRWRCLCGNAGSWRIPCSTSSPWPLPSSTKTATRQPGSCEKLRRVSGSAGRATGSARPNMLGTGPEWQGRNGRAGMEGPEWQGRTRSPAYPTFVLLLPESLIIGRCRRG